MIDFMILGAYLLGIPMALRHAWVVERRAVLRGVAPGRERKHHWYECDLGRADRLNARYWHWRGVHPPREGQGSDDCNCPWGMIWNRHGFVRHGLQGCFWPLRLIPFGLAWRALRFGVVRPWFALIHPEVAIPDQGVIAPIEKELGWNHSPPSPIGTSRSVSPIGTSRSVSPD